MIPSDVYEVLSGCTTEGCFLTLPPVQLERSLFEQVDRILENLGGKWKGNQKRYEYPFEPAELLSVILSTGVLPPKNPHAFFPTPKEVLGKVFEPILELGSYYNPARILEPSAGTGAIANKLREWFPESQIDTCEFQELNRTMLERHGFRVMADDFLTYQPTELYDLIVMNPPFSVKGDKEAYITHFNHAWQMLRTGGMIVCITPNSWLFRSQQKATQFAEFVKDSLSFDLIEAGAFKESGTAITTAFVYGTKEKPERWRMEPCGEFDTYHSYHIAMLLENEGRDIHQEALGITNWRDMEQLINRVLNTFRQETDPATPLRANQAICEELLEYFTGIKGEFEDSHSAACSR